MISGIDSQLSTLSKDLGSSPSIIISDLESSIVEAFVNTFKCRLQFIIENPVSNLLGREVCFYLLNDSSFYSGIHLLPVVASLAKYLGVHL